MAAVSFNFLSKFISKQFKMFKSCMFVRTMPNRKQNKKKVIKRAVSQVLFICVLSVFVSTPIMKVVFQFLDVKYENCQFAEAEQDQSEREIELDDVKELMLNVKDITLHENSLIKAAFFQMAHEYTCFEQSILVPPPEHLCS